MSARGIHLNSHSVNAAHNNIIETFPSLDSGGCSVDAPCTLRWVEGLGFWTIPRMAAASFIFLWLFNDQIGMVNQVLMALGLIDEPIVWLANPDTALATLVLMVALQQYL